MKAFLKTDYYLQLIMFFGYLLIGFIINLLEDEFFSVWIWFYFIVGGAQLISYIIKLCLGFWSDLFIKVYGITIMPIWIVLLLNELHINIDAINTIPFYGLFVSPFMAIAYLFYCRDKSKNPTVKL